MRQRGEAIVRLLRAGLDALVAFVLLLASVVGGPRVFRQARARADAARPGVPGGGSLWRDVVWLATPLGFLLAVFWLDLVAAGVLGVIMPAVWALDGDGRVSYQWVVVEDLSMAFFAVPVGGLMLWLAVWIAVPLLRAEAWRTRRLLAPSLSERVEWLTATRAAALDASAVELRRIERDLHDGTQAQLVALSLQLGMAEDLLDRDVEAARGLLGEARSGAAAAMADLRALVRGIVPPALAERGLGGALEAFAARSAVPVNCRVELSRALPAPVESALYFTAVELVTNAIRHSGASEVAVSVDESDARVVLRVSDEGCGGAAVGAGSGLRGLQRRLAPFDGVLTVSSPVGAGTVVIAEIPCA
jgi:signal transduction histidine kinase